MASGSNSQVEVIGQDRLMPSPPAVTYRRAPSLESVQSARAADEPYMDQLIGGGVDSSQPAEPEPYEPTELDLLCKKVECKLLIMKKVVLEVQDFLPRIESCDYSKDIEEDLDQFMMTTAIELDRYTKELQNGMNGSTNQNPEYYEDSLNFLSQTFADANIVAKASVRRWAKLFAIGKPYLKPEIIEVDDGDRPIVQTFITEAQRKTEDQALDLQEHKRRKLKRTSASE
jgi:hypothetical protein